VSNPVILHVLEALEGGTSRHVVDVARHVNGYRHEVAIPRRRPGRVTDAAAADAFRDAGAAVHIVEMRRLPVHPYNLAAAVRLRTLIAGRRPDVLHVHSSLGGAIGRVARLAARSAAPVVYTPHGINPGPAAQVVERALGRATARIVALSPSDGERLRALGLVSPERVVVIPNGIDLEPPPAGIDLRALAGAPAHVALVGAVARLVSDKAWDDFVQVCSWVGRARTDVHFVLVGGGPDQRRLEADVARSQLGGRFHQLRDVPGLAGGLDALSVLVQPSRTEAAPYAPLEAMRAGVPVVVSDAVGNRDVVEPGVSGEMRPVGDVGGMSRAVLELLDDSSRRAAMVAAARRRLAERFDVRSSARALGRLYAELLGRAGAPSA
jgi:glycosyltransferase involved in cell wall biosynthesis